MVDVICIPKTSCIATYECLLKFYPNHFRRTCAESLPGWHSMRACQSEIPVTTIREPYQRFLSAYNYYLHGSEYFQESGHDMNVFQFLEKADQINKRFIGYAKSSKETILMSKSISLDEWRLWVSSISQSYYVTPSDYSKSIVMIYNKDMGIVANKLLSYFDLVPVCELSSVNVTSYSKHYLTNKEKEKVREVYEDDFDLFESATKRPDLFRAVISSDVD